MRYILPLILLLVFVACLNAQCENGVCKLPEKKQAEPLFPLVAESFPVASATVNRVRPSVVIPNTIAVVQQGQPVRRMVRGPVRRIRTLFCR
jgi:hypothetical protein